VREPCCYFFFSEPKAWVSENWATLLFHFWVALSDTVSQEGLTAGERRWNPFIVASSKVAVWFRKKEGETQWGATQGDEAKKKLLLHLKLWIYMWKLHVKSTLIGHIFPVEINSFTIYISLSRRLWRRTTPSCCLTRRQYTIAVIASLSGRSFSWTMWSRSWKASTITPTPSSMSLPRMSSQRPASSLWLWGQTSKFQLNIAHHSFFCLLSVLSLSCFYQGEGFSKAMTATEAQAFVGDASCHVNILQVNSLVRRKKLPWFFMIDLH